MQALEDIVGEWEDAQGDYYEVMLDEDGKSCSVRTVRTSGRVQHGVQLLRYNIREGCIMWGKSYYLKCDASLSTTVQWMPTKKGKPYTWHRLDDDENAKEAVVKEELPAELLCEKEQPGWREIEAEKSERLQQVCGDWKDSEGCRYFVTLDEQGSSCSATIVSTDGKTSLDIEAIKVKESQICWRDTHHAVSVEQDQISWSTPTGIRWTWEPYGQKKSSTAFGFVCLGQTVGTWMDESKRLYTVTMDDTSSSCTVRMQKHGDRSSTIKALLKYNSDLQCVTWGRTYYLEVKSPREIMWKHLSGGKPFTWRLCDPHELAPAYVKTSQLATKQLVDVMSSKVCLMEILGSWTDSSSSYLVTMDEADSCNVQTTRASGHVRFTKRMLTYDAESACIWWGKVYYLVLTSESPASITWTPTDPSKRHSYTWYRV